MWNKVTSFAKRGWGTFKHHAQQGYKFGKQVLSDVDYGFSVAKKLHNAIAPALKDAGVHKHTKKAISDFEQIRSHVLGAHENAEKVVHAVRKGVPELGI